MIEGNWDVYGKHVIIYICVLARIIGKRRNKEIDWLGVIGQRNRKKEIGLE